MTWSHEKALQRAQDRYEQTEDLTITDVVREIDFDLISRTKPRRVPGTHFYADVSNFNQILRSGDDEEAEEMVRLLHVFNREVSKIVGDDFDGQKVHFQGPRLHALAYRPIGDESTMAAKAVLTCVAIRHTTAVFNEVFELTDELAWKIAAGLDHGMCIATRNGAGGDQELLFLGSAANRAAKILNNAGIRMTAVVRKLLSADFDSYLTQSTLDDAWHLTGMSAAKAAELADSFGWAWSVDTTRTRLIDAAQKYPASCVKVSGVKDKIDKANLGIGNTKRVFGASIFADVDGFTGYIESLEKQDPDLVEAIRAFHVLRGVMRDTAVQDFEALRIQYQGDRMQALAYRPVDNDAAVALEAVTLAAALNSVADDVVPQVVAPAAAKRLAIGLAAGEVLVSKIGEHGDRDVVSVGGSTADAAAIQQRLDGGEIRIDSTIRSLLPDKVQEAFVWSPTAKAYVASDLHYNDLALLVQSEESNRGLGLVAGTAAVAAGALGAAALVRSRAKVPTEPSKPWLNG
jgi:hypothetical protein